ncbi:MAG: GDP-L-fucose synthase [Thermodesulfobacteriota bacterium]
MSSPQLSPESRIFVAGHRGMVGSAIIRELTDIGFLRIVTRRHAELDLVSQSAVRDFFSREQIDYVILAAARVGGIHANNSYPADFIYTNLMIQTNVIHEAWRAGVTNLLFLGSSCIYPKFAPQPMKEEHLLSGELEPTNEPYAVAKIAGIKMCESYNRQYHTAYRSVMPTNLYGPGDNYHLENSHVLPAMIRKYHLAKLAMGSDLGGIQKDESHYGTIPADIKEAIGLSADSSRLLENVNPAVMLWGTGTARREFLHVDDMARACVHVMGLDQDCFTPDPALPSALSNPSFVNVGLGSDHTISEVARMVCDVIGFTGETVYDSDKPDGTPQKLLDTSRLSSLGWQPSLTLEQGIEQTYQTYLQTNP